MFIVVYLKREMYLSFSLNLLRTLRAHFILQIGASNMTERGIKELSHGFFTFGVCIDFFLVRYYIAVTVCKWTKKIKFFLRKKKKRIGNQHISSVYLLCARNPKVKHTT